MQQFEESVKQRVYVNFPFEALNRTIMTVDKTSEALDKTILTVDKTTRAVDKLVGYQNNVTKSLEHEFTRGLVCVLPDAKDYTPYLEVIPSTTKGQDALQLDGVVLFKNAHGKWKLVLLEVKNSLQMGDLDEESAAEHAEKYLRDASEHKQKKEIEKAKRKTVSRRIDRFKAIYRDTDTWLKKAPRDAVTKIEGQKFYLESFKKLGVTEDDIVGAVGANLIKEAAVREKVLSNGWYLVMRSGKGCSVVNRLPDGSENEVEIILNDEEEDQSSKSESESE